MLVSFNTVTSVGKTRIRIDEAIADALMWSTVIVEIPIDLDGMAQPAINDVPELVQTFVFEGQEELFDVRIAVGRTWRRADDLYSSAAQQLIEASFAELAITVMN